MSEFRNPAQDGGWLERELEAAVKSVMRMWNRSRGDLESTVKSALHAAYRGGVEDARAHEEWKRDQELKKDKEADHD